jgi:hypothetical protein
MEEEAGQARYNLFLDLGGHAAMRYAMMVKVD